MSLIITCPCGSSLHYADCCGQFIEGHADALTPEALMRSRYTAFVQKNNAYIEKTMRKKALKTYLEQQGKITSHDHNVIWESLEIIKSRLKSPTVGFVTFVARYSYQGTPHVLYEKSEFHKIEGQWYYVDGKFLNPAHLG